MIEKAALTVGQVQVRPVGVPAARLVDNGLPLIRQLEACESTFPLQTLHTPSWPTLRDTMTPVTRRILLQEPNI